MTWPDEVVADVAGRLIDESDDMDIAEPDDLLGLARTVAPDDDLEDDDEYEEWGATRAAGHDITPGHDNLHHWWTKGPGLALWSESPHPWTTLRNNLLKYVSPNQADRMASAWFHEVFGYWPGDRKGNNPVGPG